MAFLQSVNHISKLVDGDTADLCELFYILGELRLLDVHGLVRTPGRNHDGIILSLVLGILDMVVQIVDGIIGGAHALHVVMLHQTTGRELWLLELFVTLVEDFTGRLRIQLLGNAECSLQLQVSPVIKGITESVRHGLSPLLKFLPVAGILTCAVTLFHTIGTHSTPLVVVAAKPQLGDRLETMIVGHHFRNEVTMIVNDWHLGSMLMIKLLRNLGFENEIIVVKLLHNLLF